MSEIKNVRLGVCRVYFDGVDLGYTKGGVEVTVKTDTHKVMVDQFGKTPINEYILGREVMVKAPLAETTIEAMVTIMPGAVLVNNGVKASATATYTLQPVAAETLVIEGITFTYRVTAVTKNDIPIGATLAATLATAAKIITDNGFVSAKAAASATVVTITADFTGTISNAITLSRTGPATLSSATLLGGTNATVQRVDVPTGVGINLFDIAKKLVLHPIDLPEIDRSQDFTVYKAATPGSLNFAYKLDDERVFNTEFMGYPDSLGNLFAVGDTVNLV